MNRRWKYPLKLTFFGLTPEYKQSVHSAIFLLCYKVPGFTHKDIYNMPIHLRAFYLKEYKEWKKAENDADKQTGEQSQQQAYDQYQQTQKNPSK